MARLISLLCALAICIVVAAAVGPMRGEAAVTCGTVNSCLAPCLKYLSTANAKPDAGCCAGVNRLVKSAGTTADRRIACGCLKSTAAAMAKTIIPKNAVNLPSACGANIPYAISPATDCKRIN